MLVRGVTLNYKRLSKNDLDYIRCNKFYSYSFLDKGVSNLASKKDQDMLGAYLFFYSNLWNGRFMLLQHDSHYYKIYPECGAYYNGYKQHEIIGWYVVPDGKASQ